MLSRLPGNKIGMTQVFDENRRVIPVTVIDVTGWYVTQCKSSEQNGYTALQVGQLRSKYRSAPFALSWLKQKQKFFCDVREISLEKEEDLSKFSVGQPITLDHFNLDTGSLVDVSGLTTGRGFQGVVKRWNFGGGPKSHGSKFHRAPGSVGNMCSQGKVIKGKKLPGHYGNKKITVRGLRLVQLSKETGCLFVKGAIPGKKGSLVVIRKQG